MKTSALVTVAALCGSVLAFDAQAQEPPAPPAPPAPAAAPAPPTPATLAAVAAARKKAGPKFQNTVDFLCRDDASTANRPDDPVIEPTKLFDNLYAIGRTSTTEYVISTSDGLIMIDAGYANDVQTVLLPGLKQLGLDPATIKYVILTHGHVDHFGGAAYLQKTYGAHVGVTAEDWETMANTRPPANGPAVEQPHKDSVIVPGEPVVVGTTKVSTVLIPGHTPGALGLIFPVTDNGKKHTAAIFGGSVLIANRMKPDLLQQYIGSVHHFADETKKAGVDVEIQNHPLYDDMGLKLAALKARKAGQPNPFVLGKKDYQRFLGVIADCSAVQLAKNQPK